MIRLILAAALLAFAPATSQAAVPAGAKPTSVPKGTWCHKKGTFKFSGSTYVFTQRGKRAGGGVYRAKGNFLRLANGNTMRFFRNNGVTYYRHSDGRTGVVSRRCRKW